MYNSNDIADRIKAYVKEKGVTVTELIKACNLGANALGSMREGKMPSVERIAIIADYLDVSVDYLLGRTENKKSNYTTTDFDDTLLEAYHNKPSMQIAVCRLLGLERPANETAETTEFPPFTGRLVAADGTNIGEAVPNTKNPKIRTT